MSLAAGRCDIALSPYGLQEEPILAPSESSIEVFISYAHRDKRLLDSLNNHLAPLKNLGLIDVWHDGKILPGAEWNKEIAQHLESARIILLLVSADFLVSSYCYKNEMTRAVARHEAGESLVIPVILRKSVWENEPFGHLQALPTKGKPVVSYRQRDEGYAEIARGLAEVAELFGRARFDTREAIVAPPAAPESTTAGTDIVINPFIQRNPIADPDLLHNRVAELKMVEKCLRARGNCQIVGPSRMGRTSLLLCIQCKAPSWIPSASVAYMNTLSPFCHKLTGWLGSAAGQWGWARPPLGLPEFAAGLERMRREGKFAILCIDEFEGLRRRPQEFTRDFFETLRACSQGGSHGNMSIITASQEDLNQLSKKDDYLQMAPLAGLFTKITLDRFSAQDASAFVAVRREEVTPFSLDEQAVILGLADRHPFALQIACFHVLEARVKNEPLAVASSQANADLRSSVPGWPAGTS